MPDYKWEDEEERATVERELYTSDLVVSREEFDKRLMGEDIVGKDTRYLIWCSPARMPFDLTNEMGAAGPLEAIQAALDLHCDGGWDWLVWDRKQNVGFDIDSNTYIYAPMNKWAEEYFGLGSLVKTSSERLREFINKATEVLKQRGGL